LSALPEGEERSRSASSLSASDFTRRFGRPLSAAESDAERQNLLAKRPRSCRSESIWPIRLVDPPNDRRLPVPRGSLQALHVKLRGPCFSQTAIVRRPLLSRSHLVSEGVTEQCQSGSVSSVASAVRT
jgi:hypothetical protein